MMNTQFLSVFIPLLFAHLLTTNKVHPRVNARQDHQAAVLIKHGLIAGLTSYLALGIITAWEISLGIMVSHFLLDILKTRTTRGSKLSHFLLYQGTQLFILLLFSWAAAFYKYQETTSLWVSLVGRDYLVGITLIAGVIISVLTGSFLVELVFQKIGLQGNTPAQSGRKEEPRTLELSSTGIKDGGKIIGCLERSLIFVFILADYPAGIGFLIAAKSIFRFGELTDSDRRWQAEYIIIGTFLSILFGTLCAYLTREAIRLILL